MRKAYPQQKPCGNHTSNSLQHHVTQGTLESQVMLTLLLQKNFFQNDWPEIFTCLVKDPNRVWNIDETSLFCRTFPQRTLAKIDVRLHGSKTQKDHVSSQPA